MKLSLNSASLADWQGSAQALRPQVASMGETGETASMTRVRLLIVALSLALAGCASSGGAPASGPIGGPVSDYSGPLSGASPAQVQSQLGKPNLVRNEAGGSLWTYRFANCALLVGFSGASSSGRVTAVESGPRLTGQPAPSREACIAQAVR